MMYRDLLLEGYQKMIGIGGLAGLFIGGIGIPILVNVGLYDMVHRFMMNWVLSGHEKDLTLASRTIEFILLCAGWGNLMTWNCNLITMCGKIGSVLGRCAVAFGVPLWYVYEAVTKPEEFFEDIIVCLVVISFSETLISLGLVHRRHRDRINFGLLLSLMFM